MTESVNLSQLTLAQLVQMSQGLGHQVETLRQQRAYLKLKIAERIAAGEQEHPATPAGAASNDAVAPGAVIDIAATN